jgi:hypothetical protein
MSERTGAELIAAERQRQMSEEGWSAEHDDEHADGEMQMASTCYVVAAAAAMVDGVAVDYAEVRDGWPWHPVG